MYCHHLQKCFYNRNITFKYCFICKINTRGYLSEIAPLNTKWPYFAGLYLAHFEKL